MAIESLSGECDSKRLLKFISIWSKSSSSTILYLNIGISGWSWFLRCFISHKSINLTLYVLIIYRKENYSYKAPDQKN